jgi:hypothetical protein
MADTDKQVLKEVLELCKNGIKQAEKDAESSVVCAESFANGQYVAYAKVVELIMRMKQEVVFVDKEAWDSIANTVSIKTIRENWKKENE